MTRQVLRMHPNTFLLLALFLLVPLWATAEDSATGKTSALTAVTPAPTS